MGKYLDPKADLTFKKIFGEHKELIISLLNALLPLEEDEKIIEVDYLPSEIVPDDPLHKDSIVDVRCTDQDKRQFVVEMQMIWSPDYNQRVLFNACKAYVRQLPRAGEYKKLKPVYSLNLLNDTLEPDMADYYHHYQLEHHQYKGKIIHGLQIVFVELPKFKPQTFSEKKMHILWLRFLTEINEDTRVVPQELLENPEVKAALDMVEESALTPDERARYDGFQDWLRRQKSWEVYEAEMKEKYEAEIKKKAEERLVKMQEQLGQTQEQLDEAKAKFIETARKLKAMNVMTTEQIAEATGLTAEEIEGL